jgi:hypothetical protein
MQSCLLGAGAGLLLAIAALGRQPYICGVVVAPLLATSLTRRQIAPLLVFFMVALLPVCFVFAIWGGMVPPKAASLHRGFSVWYGFLSFGYASIVYSLYETQWLRQRLVTKLVILVLAVAVNGVFGFYEITPLVSVMQRLLYGPLLTAYSRLCAGLLIGLALLFIAHLINAAYEYRGNRKYLYLLVLAFVFLIVPIKLTNEFSGRYILPAMPPLAAFAELQFLYSPWKVFRVLIGCVLGLLSLASYLYLA